MLKPAYFRLPVLQSMAMMVAGSVMIAAISTASAQEAEFPEEGKPITMIVTFSAGGPTDLGARMLVPFLEEELGTTIEVVNKPGASQQIGLTELVSSDPDGYTIAMVAPPSAVMTYLDETRQAPYSREDILPIAHYTSEANLLIVPGDSPYQSVEDLVAAAKETPKQITIGTSGLMGNTHLAGIALEEASGAEFAFVHFDGAAPLATAMLGGNLDAAISGILATMPHERAGKMRVLATFDNKKTSFFPDAEPAIDQGFDVYSPTSFGIVGPAGIPDDIVQILSNAVKAAMESDGFKEKIEHTTLVRDYMNPEGFARLWIDMETRTGKLLEIAKSQQAAEN